MQLAFRITSIFILLPSTVWSRSSQDYVFNYAGPMKGLEQPLKNESFWLPDTCKLALNESTLKPKSEEKKGRRRKGERPPGWNKETLKYGEFILDEAVKSIFRDSTHKYHPFLSKQMCSEDLDIRAKKIAKSRISQGKVDHEYILMGKRKNCSNLPSLRSKSWGKCAFVAPGSNLLKHKRGEQIDLQDTVIRVGHMPLIGWIKVAGSRTDILIGRGTIQSKYAHTYNSLKYLIGKDSSGANMSSTHELEIADSLNFYPLLGHVNHVKVNLGSPQVGDAIYRVMTSPIGKKYRGMSTGFQHALRIIFSGLCSRVHIFGLSSDCGGYYHNQNVKMKLHHSCELESWILHYLMKVHGEYTNLCVWNT